MSGCMHMDPMDWCLSCASEKAKLWKERADKVERERDKFASRAVRLEHQWSGTNVELAEAREDIKALVELVRCGFDMDRMERQHPNGRWKLSWQRIRDRKLLEVSDGTL